MGGFPRASSSGLDPLASAEGYKGWCVPNFNAPGTALTSQEIDATALWIPNGSRISNIHLQVVTAGSGVPPTGFFVGLATETKMVAQSANLASSTELTSAGIATLALSAAYTTNPTDSPDGIYYVVYLENGAFGTTAMTVGRIAASPVYGLAFPLGGVVGTLQTALPANGAAITVTPSAANALRWVAVS